MNNPKLYTEDEYQAARLKGRKEAEEYLQARIDNICKTNRQLLLEIMRLDRIEPVVGVFVPDKIISGLSVSCVNATRMMVTPIC